jgi:S-(hydroxymethyl)glutathione dehydrogenase / alcohol dehydrogenase
VSATTIRAAVCRVFGEPLTIERLELAAPAQGEVRVRLRAVAICHSDVSGADGAWGGVLPIVYGHEAAGVIAEVGPGVELEVGQPVVVTLIRACGECRHCTRGEFVACTTTFALDEHSPLTTFEGETVVHGLRTAAFAEQVVVHASQVIAIDDTVDPKAASLLACGVITGVGAVVNTAAVEPGSTVVVIGCGGVGLNVVQGARLAGATTIVAVDVQPTKLDLARRLGATHVAQAGTDDVPAVVGEASDGLMADYAFVATGSPAALGGALALVGAMGALVIVGMPPKGVTGSYDPGWLAGLNQRILGSKMGTSVITRDVPALLARYRAGELELDALISRTFTLDQINEAMDEVRAGSALRNVIVFDDV